ILPGQARFLGTVYAFGAMLSFTIAHLAVIGLRVKQADRERPYRGPGTLRIRGYELPAFAVFGGLGTGIAWLVVTVLNFTTLLAGAGSTCSSRSRSPPAPRSTPRCRRRSSAPRR